MRETSGFVDDAGCYDRANGKGRRAKLGPLSVVSISSARRRYAAHASHASRLFLSPSFCRRPPVSASMAWSMESSSQVP